MTNRKLPKGNQVAWPTVVATFLAAPKPRNYRLAIRVGALIANLARMAPCRFIERPLRPKGASLRLTCTDFRIAAPQR